MQNDAPARGVNRINRLLLGGHRRVFASSLVGKPLLPLGRVVGPFLHLDAPRRRLAGQEERIALRKGEATRNVSRGVGHQGVGVGKDGPDPRRPVPRRGDDALAVGAERRGRDRTVMTFELADLPSRSRRPRRAPSLSPDAVTIRLLSMLNAAAYTAPLWPLSGSPMGSPLSASQIRCSIVVRRGDDASAVGAVRGAKHGVCMPLKRGAVGESAEPLRAKSVFSAATAWSPLLETS